MMEFGQIAHAAESRGLNEMDWCKGCEANRTKTVRLGKAGNYCLNCLEKNPNVDVRKVYSFIVQTTPKDQQTQMLESLRKTRAANPRSLTKIFIQFNDNTIARNHQRESAYLIKLNEKAWRIAFPKN